MTNEQEQTFADAFAHVESRLDLEATLLERNPELGAEEQQLIDVEAAEVKNDLSHGITYERSGDGRSILTEYSHSST